VTEKQRLALLNKARVSLEKTSQGYVQWIEEGQRGGHWRDAIVALDKLEADLRPSPLAPLGPVWIGGKSVLDHDLTHATSGVPLYPAFDDAFNQGRVIVAPEALTVTRSSSSHPGLAFYATGKSKIRYWFGHLDRTHPSGTKFAKGDAVGKVAANAIGGGPHVHVGVNVELLLGNGKQLVHKTSYQHGAPTIRAQLERALL
jgi:hypothetical protein